MARKKSVQESMQMSSAIDENKIRQEITRMMRKQWAVDKTTKLVKDDEARLATCNNFNKKLDFYEQKAINDAKDEKALILMELAEAEKMNNPFYATLKAQKEERIAFLAQHEQQTALALVSNSE